MIAEPSASWQSRAMRVAILLAAGASRRFGRADKLVARVGGRPLIEHALRIAEAAPVGRVVVATAARGPRLRLLDRIAGPRTTIVRVARPARGLSESLKAALAVLRPIEREAYVFLADMPSVPRQLAARLRFAPARPHHRGRPGHPVLIARPDRATIAALSGDSGMRALIGLDRVTWTAAGPGCIADIDDARALRRLRLSRRRR